jgi:hypothetical protein
MRLKARLLASLRVDVELSIASTSHLHLDLRARPDPERKGQPARGWLVRGVEGGWGVVALIGSIANDAEGLVVCASLVGSRGVEDASEVPVRRSLRNLLVLG